MPIDPFDLVLNRPQAWPGRLAVLWASEVPPVLVGLHARFSRVLRGMNIAVDANPYCPT